MRERAAILDKAVRGGLSEEAKLSSDLNKMMSKDQG